MTFMTIARIINDTYCNILVFKCSILFVCFWFRNQSFKVKKNIVMFQTNRLHILHKITSNCIQIIQMSRWCEVDDLLIEIPCPFFGLEHNLVLSRTKVADVLGCHLEPFGLHFFSLPFLEVSLLCCNFATILSKYLIRQLN